MKDQGFQKDKYLPTYQLLAYIIASMYARPDI